MKETPLVSVIIPNYQRISELKRSIISVINQTYKNFEIVVIDDYSNNLFEIRNLINDINDHRIYMIESKINGGAAAARNKGILAAKGEYIAFLDSDDCWEKTILEKKINLVKDIKNNVLVYNKVDVRGKNRNLISPKKGIKEHESYSEYLFLNQESIYTPTIFVSSKIAKECLFDESFARHEDLNFLFNLERKNVEFLFIDEVLTTVYWVVGGNPIKKGWSTKLAKKLISNNKDLMTEKSYWNAYFSLVINDTGLFSSKIESFILFIKNIKYCVKFVNKKSIIKYFIRLVADWRYIFDK